MTRSLGSLDFTTIPPAAEALRGEVKAFLQTALKGLPAETRARSWMGFDAAFSRALAARGWVGVTLPREYGGAELSPFARFVLVEELLAAGAPVAAHWIADRQSGPLINRFGNAAQKAFYLPQICRGEAFFCIGMSEPNSGSDLASVRSRATPEGNGWLLNGSKIWTSFAHHAHYMIALVRTSGSPEDRQKGLSQVIVDLKLPGVTVRPIKDLTGDAHFCEVHFEDVQLSEDALIGREGAGWEQVNAELAFERSGPERLYSSIVLLDTWIETLRKSGRKDDATVVLVGRIVGQLAVLRAMSIAITGKLAAGETPLIEAALVKEMGTTLEQAVPGLIADALGAVPTQAVDGALYRTLAYVTQIAPAFSLRGGTREILRGMIARGLGLR